MLKNSFKTIIGIIVAIVMLDCHAQSYPLQELQKLLSSISTMQAEFKQTVMSDKNNVLHVYHGLMAFKKPNLFRWQVDQPEESLIVTDGHKLWNYDVNLEQVTVEKFNANHEITPLSFVLDDPSKLSTNFNVERLPKSCYKLTPKQENNSFVNVAVCFKSDKISSVKVVDHFGQTTIFDFFKIKNNDQLQNVKFSFTPPAGVDVIGER